MWPSGPQGGKKSHRQIGDVPSQPLVECAPVTGPGVVEALPPTLQPLTVLMAEDCLLLGPQPHQEILHGVLVS